MRILNLLKLKEKVISHKKEILSCFLRISLFSNSVLLGIDNVKWKVDKLQQLYYKREDFLFALTQTTKFDENAKFLINKWYFLHQ